MNRGKLKWLLVIFAFAIAPVAALGQSNLDPGQLPKSTVFYLAWHGTPAGEVRKANSLWALWDDADFASVRAAMIEKMTHNSASSQKGGAPVTQEELARYAALLDNEFVVGYMGNPNPTKTVEKPTGSPANNSQANKWNGLFFVYDRTGKEATLASLLMRSRMNEKDPPKISTTTVAGISAIKEERKSGTSYWAEDGKYAFGATEPIVFEQIAAWTKHATPQAASLAQTAGYREASGVLKGGLVEFYFHFPSLQEMNWDTSLFGFRMRPLVQSLKLEMVHSIAGRVLLEGARTRVQGAILGEANPGSLFDIWDEGTTTPSSWQFISSNTVSYQESRVNLLGVYGVIKRALQSSAGDGQQNPIDSMETAFATRLGMPLPAAVGLFTGEFAAVQTSPALDPAKQAYMIGVRKKPETLKLLRAGFADRLSAERLDGDTTFFKISEGGMASAAGTASWKYYHAGMTADLIVWSSSNATLRETLASGKHTAGENAQVPPAWQAAREQFPKSINGLSFFDFQKIDWAAAKERWAAKPRKVSSSENSAGNKASMAPDASASVLKELDPKVFSRHLYLAASASWKDAHGMHFDGWIE